MNKLIAGAALLALLLPACGGGSTAPVALSAELQGTVYEVDGQTVDRSGIEVRVVETGDTIVTGRDGSFSFPDLDPGAYTLEFNSLRAARQRAGTERGFDDESEDHEGRPKVEVVEITKSCGKIEVRVSFDDGSVKEFTIESHRHNHAKARLEPVGDFAGEGKVKIGSHDDHEGIGIKAEGLEPETEVTFCLDDGTGAVDIGTATADEDGDAKFLALTDRGDTLPLGVASVADLAGFAIAVKVGDTTVLTGTVPELPSHDCDDDGDGEPDRKAVLAKARLDALVDGVEAEVKLFSWPAKGKEKFEMEIEGPALAEGDLIAFEIQDESGAWVLLASVPAEADDDGGEAEVETDDDEDGIEIPLGKTSVQDLVGLNVRIRRDEADDQTVLAEGTIPGTVSP